MPLVTYFASFLNNLFIILFYAKIRNMNIINIKDKSGKLYYVGGIVRDEILGIENLDIDLIYEGNAIDYAKSQNLEIIQINEPFKTVRVKIDGKSVDIASTRCETYPKAGHLPKVSDIGCSLMEDVKRRDFTINSLYKSVKTGEIIDFTDGLEDLKNKKLKVLHEKSFIEDPTRILRALKFRMRFGFELDEGTKKLQIEYLKNINYDMCYQRIKKELIELFGYKGKSKLNMNEAFEIFVNENIYKLITQKTYKPSIPQDVYTSNYQWLTYVGLIEDLSRIPLSKNEQKILNDFAKIKNIKLKSDIEIYKAFQNCLTETAILYGNTVNKNIANHYLNNLKNVKLKITGQDFKNPKMTKQDELNIVKNYIL